MDMTVSGKQSYPFLALSKLTGCQPLPSPPEMASCCLDTPQIPLCWLGQFLPRTPTPSPRGKQDRVQLVWFLLCSRSQALLNLSHIPACSFCHVLQFCPAAAEEPKEEKGWGWRVEGKALFIQKPNSHPSRQAIWSYPEPNGKRKKPT